MVFRAYLHKLPILLKFIICSLDIKKSILNIDSVFTFLNDLVYRIKKQHWRGNTDSCLTALQFFERKSLSKLLGLQYIILMYNLVPICN